MGMSDKRGSVKDEYLKAASLYSKRRISLEEFIAVLRGESILSELEEQHATQF